MVYSPFPLFVVRSMCFRLLNEHLWELSSGCVTKVVLKLRKPLFSVYATWLCVCRNNREEVWDAVKADLHPVCPVCVCVCVCFQGSFYVPSENCLQRAYTWHRRICKLLLVAHRALRSYYTALMKEIPQLQRMEMGINTTSYVTHSF